MSINEFISKMETMKNGLANVGERTTLILAVTGVTLIKERIRTKGVGQYSDYQIPTGAFDAFNAGGRKFKEKNKKGSHKELRKSLGLQTDYVDLTFTGRMLNNTQVRGIKKLGQLQFVATAEPNQEAERKKLEKHNKRYGKVMTLDEKQVTALQEDFDKMIGDYVKTALK